jgi:uridine phosphorylase
MAKNVHMDALDLLKMVQLEAGSLGKYSLVPGPIERLQPILTKLEDPIRDFSFSGIEMHTGEFGDVLVTAANTGMYAPPAAITTEMLAAGGAETVIRVGSCGAMREDIAIGDLIIVSGCVRGEGTTKYYVPDSFSTVADIVVTSALIEACENLNLTYHVGTVWSTDALLRETKELIEEMCELNTVGVDMVSSALFTVAQLKGLKAGGVLAVSDNLITGELGFVSPRFYEAETKTIDVAFEAIRILESKK